MAKEKNLAKTRKLNIGCGFKHKDDFINIDIAKEVKPDLVVDITQGLPFPDNFFEEIYSSHTLEHVEPCHWRFVLKEIARVSKHKCKLILDLPFDNIYQRSHADHFRVFNWDSFTCLYEKSGVNHYSDLVLKNLQPRPHVCVRLWYNLFPFTLQNVHFEFEIIKRRTK